jgi:hypothetical protein
MLWKILTPYPVIRLQMCSLHLLLQNLFQVDLLKVQLQVAKVAQAAQQQVAEHSLAHFSQDCLIIFQIT